MEIELKLSLPQNALAALRSHPVLNGAAARRSPPKQLVSTYFDTPDHSLLKAGFGLRVREDDGRFVQTLKSAGDGSGAAAFRNEWDWPIDTRTPDLPVMGPVPGMETLLPDLEKNLQPVFVTDFSRTVFLVSQDDHLIELAIDEGAVRCGDAMQPLLEVELELKTGPASALYHLALSLMRSLPLTIAAVSKAERGYRMLGALGVDPVKSRLPPLEPSMLARDAMQGLIGEGLHHLLANDAPTRAGEPEGLHQMRVALRRLRGVLFAFAPWLEPISAARYEAALKQAGRVMGHARDWDIFCLDMMPGALEALPASWRNGVVAAATAQRKTAHESLEKILLETVFSQTLLSLNAWAAKPDRQDALDTSLAEIAPVMLDRLARKVLKSGKTAFSGTDHDLHQLRKSLKKLRYIIDDVGFLYGDKAVRAYLKPCKHLQASLGDFNDAVTATHLATQLADGDRTDLLPVLHDVFDWAARQKERALRHAESVWADFVAADPFW